MKLAVLVSGAGTLLEAMTEAGVPIDLVVADRACRAVEIGTDSGVTSLVYERVDYHDDFDRDAYAAGLADLLVHHEIDIVAMAGFGTILGAPIFETYAGRVINTHPSLLPAFPGWHAVRDALAFGAKITGCTIHIATRQVDDGPILAQAPVEVFDSDDEATLHERIKVVERRLYIDTLRSILAGAHAVPDDS